MTGCHLLVPNHVPQIGNHDRNQNYYEYQSVYFWFAAEADRWMEMSTPRRLEVTEWKVNFILKFRLFLQDSDLGTLF